MVRPNPSSKGVGEVGSEPVPLTHWCLPTNIFSVIKKRTMRLLFLHRQRLRPVGLARKRRSFERLPNVAGSTL